MKKIILIITLSIFTLSVKSQAQDSVKTLLHFPKLNYVGFYFAPEFQYGQSKNQFTPFLGGSAMIILNKTFAFGGTFQNSIDRGFSPTGISPLYLHSRFGGLRLEYTVNPNSAIHLSFPLVIGGGSASTDSFTNNRRMMNRDSIGKFGRNTNKPLNETNYFVIQPGVELEGNLLPFVKLFVGANYRFAFDTHNMNNPVPLPAATMQGLSANIGIKVGYFNFRTHKQKSLD